MRNSGPVVIRNRPLGRFGGAAVVGLFAVSGWWGMAASVATGQWDWPIRDMHPNGVGIAVLWVLMPLVTWVLTYLTLFCLFMRQTFDTDGGTVRKVVRTRRVPLAAMTRIEYQGFVVHTGTAQLPAQRLVVFTDLGPPPVRMVLQGGVTHVAEALEVIREWVRQRPELVRGTNAESDFASRLDAGEPTD